MITGATAGFGKASAKIGENGYKVIITGRRKRNWMISKKNLALWGLKSFH